MRIAWRRLLPLLCVGLLSSCVAGMQDHPVRLSLTNAGVTPLRCRLQFGHWVDRDLGELAPGSVAEIPMMQAARDGALYVLRADGERQMMVETMQCARPGDWFASFSQVDLGPVRGQRAREIKARCSAPPGKGRVACRLDRVAL